MKIEDLKPRFTDLPYHEQLDLVVKIRSNRRGDRKTKKQRAKAKRTVVDLTITNTIKNLTPEQLQALKELMKGEL